MDPVSDSKLLNFSIWCLTKNLKDFAQDKIESLKSRILEKFYNK